MRTLIFFTIAAFFIAALIFSLLFVLPSKTTSLGFYCKSEEVLEFDSKKNNKQYFLNRLDFCFGKGIEFRAEMIGELEKLCQSEENAYTKKQVFDLSLDYKIHTLAINKKDKNEIYRYFYNAYSFLWIFGLISIVSVLLFLCLYYFLSQFEEINQPNNPADLKEHKKMKTIWIVLTCALFFVFSIVFSLNYIFPHIPWAIVAMSLIFLIPLLGREISKTFKKIKRII